MSPSFELNNYEDGKVFLSQPYSYHVFAITKDNINIFYSWDFGKFNIEFNDNNREYTPKEQKTSFLDKYVFMVLANLQNSNINLIQFNDPVTQHISTVIYNKKTFNYLKFSDLTESIGFPAYPIIRDNKIIKIVDNLEELNLLLNNSVINKHLINLNKDYFYDNNPIIIVYSLKDISQ